MAARVLHHSDMSFRLVLGIRPNFTSIIKNRVISQPRLGTLTKISRNGFHTRSLLSKELEKLREESPKSRTTKKFENIYTIPNALTVTRLISAPVVGYLLVAQKPYLAMSAFIYSCLTDFIDGYIARKYNMKSVIGSILDPMADKLLMTVCTACLTYTHDMPTYLGSFIIGRDVMLSIMAFYYRYITLPSPKTFRRYFDLSLPSASVHPNMLSKVNTALQMVYIGTLVVKPYLLSFLIDDNYTQAFDICLHLFEIVVASTTILSGASYIVSSKAIKMVK